LASQDTVGRKESRRRNVAAATSTHRAPPPAGLEHDRGAVVGGLQRGSSKCDLCAYLTQINCQSSMAIG